MGQWVTNRNPWAGYRMGPSPNLYVRQTEGSQIGDQRLNTSCGVVKRPDYQCGDDLVSKTTEEP